MTRRIDTLTDEQRAQMDAHADKWIAAGWSTEPADFDRFTKAAEACYGFAGLPWHGNVVRVSSPLTLSLVAPLAAYELALRKHSVVHDAVHSAVHDAVRDAVRDAVGGAVTKGARDAIFQSWYYRLWGNLYPWWQAYHSYFRDICGLQLDGDLWDRARAYEETALSAGWWWPHKEFVIVCDRPAELHLEQIGPRGWGSHRLHNATGPAIAWRDGYALHYWHGVRVPADLIDGKWTTTDILRERNAEIRRCAIEHMGWDRFIAEAGLTRIGPTAADPGNPGYHLALYEVPEAEDGEPLFEEPVNVLLAVNGSVERDGTRRQFGLTVPSHILDPIEAAAWTYGITSHEYRQLEARR